MSSEHHDSWGSKVFSQVYQSRIKALLESLAEITRSVVSFEIENSRTFIFSRNSNVFCEQLRKLPWGEAACCRDEAESMNSASEYSGNPIRHDCYMGLRNYICSFEIIGLGRVTIRLGRIPLVNKTGSRATSALEEAMNRKKISAREYKRLIDLIERVNQRPGKSSAEIAELLKQISQTIKMVLELGISNHLTTRSSLHEIMVTMTATSGSSDYILDRTSQPEWEYDRRARESVLANISTISDQTRLAIHLARNLLERYSSQQDDDLMITAQEEFHIDQELSRIARAWERMSRHKNIDVRYQSDSEYTTKGDKQLLRQLFHNLLSNAIKYSYTPSNRGESRYINITVKLHDPGFRERRVEIDISNYGIGILEDELEHLGEPGFRGRLASKERPDGLGIGVYLAKRIVKLHGGEIKYKCRYLHDGTYHVKGQQVSTKTYLVQAVVLLPVS